MDFGWFLFCILPMEVFCLYIPTFYLNSESAKIVLQNDPQIFKIL